MYHDLRIVNQENVFVIQCHCESQVRSVRRLSNPTPNVIARSDTERSGVA